MGWERSGRMGERNFKTRIMGLFSKPKCPYCGGPVVPTGYSLPFPGWRCNNCYQKNAQKKEMKEMKDKIKELEDKINKKDTP